MEAEKIDVVVNCAGFGISGAVEFTPLDQAKAQFDVNFFGTVNVNKAVLPSMREAGKGHIINISSVAAVAHIPFQAFYSASKAAISSYSCALDNEVNQRYYIQVAYDMTSEEKQTQEFNSLRNIPDSFKKIVLVNGSKKPWRNEEGFVIMGMKYFLLNANSLEF